MEFTKQSVVKFGGIALSFMIALSLLAGFGAAISIATEEVEIEEPDDQEIVVDAELLEDPETSNPMVTVTDENAEVVAETNLTSDIDEWDAETEEWVTEKISVETEGNYTVEVTADSEDAIGQTVIVVEDQDIIGAVSGGQHNDLILGFIAVVAIGALLVRERT